jgi:hypothetical protein
MLDHKAGNNVGNVRVGFSPDKQQALLSFQMQFGLIGIALTRQELEILRDRIADELSRTVAIAREPVAI